MTNKRLRHPGRAPRETADELAQLAAEPDPVARALAVGAIAQRRGTLPATLAGIRRAALLEARAEPRRISVKALAEALGITSARVSQLTAPTEVTDVVVRR